MISYHPFVSPVHLKVIMVNASENIQLITGTEALYAGLSQFPVLSIQLAFITVVFPCLLLAYVGQAAYLMQNKDNVYDVFYRSFPGSVSSIL